MHDPDENEIFRQEEEEISQMRSPTGRDRERLFQIMRTFCGKFGCRKIIAGILIAAVIAAAAVFLAVHALLLHLNRYYDRITLGMTLSQVRQSMTGNFRESVVSISAIEKEGYPLKHLIPDGENIHARKYASHIWERLYFYVIYDSADKVRLTIAAFE